MVSSKKKCFIFDSCKLMFPPLEMSLKMSLETKDAVEMVAHCKDESDLKIIKEDCEPLKGQFRVRLFVEFELENKIRRHPSFVLELDYANQRAEVISFESNLYPHIRLDVYTEVDGEIFTNIVAKQDLKTLCKNWLKQLNELNYKLQWQEKIQTA